MGVLRAVAGSSGGGAAGSIVVGNPVTGGVAYAVLKEDGSGNLSADSTLLFGSAAAGHGLQITPAAPATTAVPPLITTQALNNVAISFPGVVHAFTGGATAAAGTNLFSVTLDAANMMVLTKAGALTLANNLTLTQGAGKGVYVNTGSNAVGMEQQFNGSAGLTVGGNTILGFDASGFYSVSSGAYYFSSSTTDPLGKNAAISRGGANTIRIGVTAGTNDASGTLQLTNLVTTATSSTGTAAIIDGSNVLRPLTSSRRFKKNDAPWSASAGQLSAFLKLSASTWDYEDHRKRVVLDGMTLRTEGENREGVKGVLGFIAEEMHDAGLTEMLNYDAAGLPYSLREHGVLAYMHAALKNHESRMAKARI